MLGQVNGVSPLQGVRTFFSGRVVNRENAQNEPIIRNDNHDNSMRKKSVGSRLINGAIKVLNTIGWPVGLVFGVKPILRQECIAEVLGYQNDTPPVIRPKREGDQAPISTTVALSALVNKNIELEILYRKDPENSREIKAKRVEVAKAIKNFIKSGDNNEGVRLLNLMVAMAEDPLALKTLMDERAQLKDSSQGSNQAANQDNNHVNVAGTAIPESVVDLFFDFMNGMNSSHRGVVEQMVQQMKTLPGYAQLVRVINWKSLDQQRSLINGALTVYIDSNEKSFLQRMWERPFLTMMGVASGTGWLVNSLFDATKNGVTNIEKSGLTGTFLTRLLEGEGTKSTELSELGTDSETRKSKLFDKFKQSKEFVVELSTAVNSYILANRNAPPSGKALPDEAKEAIRDLMTLLGKKENIKCFRFLLEVADEEVAARAAGYGDGRVLREISEIIPGPYRHAFQHFITGLAEQGDSIQLLKTVVGRISVTDQQALIETMADEKHWDSGRVKHMPHAPMLMDTIARAMVNQPDIRIHGSIAANYRNPENDHYEVNSIAAVGKQLVEKSGDADQFADYIRGHSGERDRTELVRLIRNLSAQPDFDKAFSAVLGELPPFLSDSMSQMKKDYQLESLATIGRNLVPHMSDDAICNLLKNLPADAIEVIRTKIDESFKYIGDQDNNLSTALASRTERLKQALGEKLGDRHLTAVLENKLRIVFDYSDTPYKEDLKSEFNQWIIGVDQGLVGSIDNEQRALQRGISDTRAAPILVARDQLVDSLEKLSTFTPRDENPTLQALLTAAPETLAGLGDVDTLTEAQQRQIDEIVELQGDAIIHFTELLATMGIGLESAEEIQPQAGGRVENASQNGAEHRTETGAVNGAASATPLTDKERLAGLNTALTRYVLAGGIETTANAIVPHPEAVNPDTGEADQEAISKRLSPSERKRVAIEALNGLSQDEVKPIPNVAQTSITMEQALDDFDQYKLNLISDNSRLPLAGASKKSAVYIKQNPNNRDFTVRIFDASGKSSSYYSNALEEDTLNEIRKKFGIRVEGGVADNRPVLSDGALIEKIAGDVNFKLFNIEHASGGEPAAPISREFSQGLSEKNQITLLWGFTKKLLAKSDVTITKEGIVDKAGNIWISKGRDEWVQIDGEGVTGASSAEPPKGVETQIIMNTDGSVVNQHGKIFPKGSDVAENFKTFLGYEADVKSKQAQCRVEMRKLLRANLNLFANILAEKNDTKTLKQFLKTAELPPSIQSMFITLLHEVLPPDIVGSSSGHKVIKSILNYDDDLKDRMIEIIPDNALDAMSNQMTTLINSINPYEELPFFSKFAETLEASLGEVTVVQRLVKALTKGYYIEIPHCDKRAMSMAVLEVGKPELDDSGELKPESLRRLIGAITKSGGPGFQKAMQLFKNDIKTPSIREALDETASELDPITLDEMDVKAEITSKLAGIEQMRDGVKETYSIPTQQELDGYEAYCREKGITDEATSCRRKLSQFKVLGAATIAQTHLVYVKCKLENSDDYTIKPMAIKVRRPQVGHRILREMNALRTIPGLKPSVVDTLKELENSIMAEISFDREYDFAGYMRGFYTMEKAKAPEGLKKGDSAGYSVNVTNMVGVNDTILVQEFVTDAKPLSGHWQDFENEYNELISNESQNVEAIKQNLEEKLRFLKPVTESIHNLVGGFASGAFNGDVNAEASRVSTILTARRTSDHIGNAGAGNQVPNSVEISKEITDTGSRYQIRFKPDEHSEAVTVEIDGDAVNEDQDRETLRTLLVELYENDHLSIDVDAMDRLYSGAKNRAFEKLNRDVELKGQITNTLRKVLDKNILFKGETLIDSDRHGGNLLYNKDKALLTLIDTGAGYIATEHEKDGMLELTDGIALGEVNSVLNGLTKMIPDLQSRAGDRYGELVTALDDSINCRNLEEEKLIDLYNFMISGELMSPDIKKDQLFENLNKPELKAMKEAVLNFDNDDETAIVSFREYLAEHSGHKNKHGEPLNLGDKSDELAKMMKNLSYGRVFTTKFGAVPSLVDGENSLLLIKSIRKIANVLEKFDVYAPEAIVQLNRGAKFIDDQAKSVNVMRERAKAQVEAFNRMHPDSAIEMSREVNITLEPMDLGSTYLSGLMATNGRCASIIKNAARHLKVGHALKQVLLYGVNKGIHAGEIVKNALVSTANSAANGLYHYDTMRRESPARKLVTVGMASAAVTTVAAAASAASMLGR